MSKLVKCRGCQQLVHPSAKTCPNCGVGKPGVNTTQGCLIATGIVLLMLIQIGDHVFNGKTEAEKAEQQKPKTPEEIRGEKISKQFFPFSGEHANLARFVKANMKNPDSYDHVKTVYLDKGDYLIVETTYRGTNSFGGVVPNTIKAKVDIDGNLIDILK